MSESMIFDIIMVALYVYGFWRGWKHLTKGNGFLASRIPEKSLAWLNQKQPGSVAAKIGVSLVLAYIFAAVAIVIGAYALLKIVYRFVNS